MSADETVRNGQLCRAGDVFRGDRIAVFKSGQRLCGLENDDIGAVPFKAERCGQFGDRIQIKLRVGNFQKPF